MLFCGVRKGLTKPFNIAPYTYVTDGHIALRLESLERYDANEPYAGIKAIQFLVDIPDFLFEKLPDRSELEKTEECPECHGHGSGSPCSDCRGKGEVSWTSEGGYDYEDDCQMCNGQGKLKECDNCGSTGKVIVTKYMDIKSKTLDCELLIKLSKLPNVLIAPEAVPDLKPIPFKFDGGVGVICPSRKPNK
jgi:hypothetical protein